MCEAAILSFDPEFLYFLKTNFSAGWTAGSCLLGSRVHRKQLGDANPCTISERTGMGRVGSEQAVPHSRARPSP